MTRHRFSALIVLVGLLAAASWTVAQPQAAPEAPEANEAAPATPIQAAPGQPGQPGQPGVGTPPSPEDEELAEMRKKGARLQIEAQLHAAKMAKELRELQDENARLQAEYTLEMQRQKNAMLKGELDKQRLAADAAAKEAELNASFTDKKLQMTRWQHEAAFAKAKMEAELADAKAKLERLNAQQQLTAAQRDLELGDLKSETARLTTLNGKLQAQMLEAKLQSDLIQSRNAAEMAELAAARQLREAKNADKKVVTSDVAYPKNPFNEGTLTISDRRIPLNGPIAMRTADFVCDRIQFLNNKNAEAPIFIVIDTSPGGSVMAGYRILKSMEASKAPIHVVVKSFAASMAAAITTLADHSYAYPNAVMLHHQMSSGMSGNVTQQRESLKEIEEWSRRLAGPIAKKMGVTEKEMVRMMYENNSDGDWAEFADQAVKLKWVDHLAMEVRETGITDQPEEQPVSFFLFQADDKDGPQEARIAPRGVKITGGYLLEQRDAQGRRYVELPRLQPFDAYFMYDPDNYYRY